MIVSSIRKKDYIEHICSGKISYTKMYKVVKCICLISIFILPLVIIISHERWALVHTLKLLITFFFER